MKKFILTIFLSFSLFLNANSEDIKLKNLEKKCNDGNLEICEVVGILYFNGTDDIRDHTKAEIFFRKACDGGNMSGCSQVGAIYFFGMGAEQDYVKAKPFYKKTCSAKDKLGCLRLKEIDCIMGNFDSCEYSARHYKNGEIVEKDYKKASLYYKYGCDNNSSLSCIGYSTLFSNGRGVEKDKKKELMEEDTQLPKSIIDRDKNISVGLKNDNKLTKKQVKQLTLMATIAYATTHMIYKGMDKNEIKKEVISTKHMNNPAINFVIDYVFQQKRVNKNEVNQLAKLNGEAIYEYLKRAILKNK